jgi:hypothetical protein
LLILRLHLGSLWFGYRDGSLRVGILYKFLHFLFVIRGLRVKDTHSLALLEQLGLTLFLIVRIFELLYPSIN